MYALKVVTFIDYQQPFQKNVYGTVGGYNPMFELNIVSSCKPPATSALLYYGDVKRFVVLRTLEGLSYLLSRQTITHQECDPLIDFGNKVCPESLN